MPVHRLLFGACVVALLAAGSLRAQTPSAVHVVVVASDGTASDAYSGAEELAEDLGQAVAQSFPVNLKRETAVRATDNPDGLLPAVARAASACDSNDVFLVFWIGPWNRILSDLPSSAWIAPGSQNVTAEYIEHLVSFVPARAVAAFVVAPPERSFPSEYLSTYPAARATGGKHLFVVTGKDQATIEDLVAGMVDAAEATAEPGAADGNKNGSVSFAEWLAGFYRFLKAEGHTMKGYTIASGRNPFVGVMRP